MGSPANLNFDLAPSPAVVFGCLLPAPWLGATVGLLLAFGPEQGMPERFAPLTLSLVHLLAVGMLMPVMLGALFQLFPVLAGVPVPGARWLAPCVVPCCVGTACCLSWGFLGGEIGAFRLAVGFAAVGLGSLAVMLAVAGRRVVVANLSTRVLRWIAWSLGLTLAFGVALAGMFGFGWAIPIASLLDLHMGWGVGGWLVVLLAGVAATVLPMFWQTPRLSPRAEWLLPGLIWLPLALGLLELLGYRLPWRTLAWTALAVLSAVGSYAVLRAKRRRDPAWVLWCVAVLSWFTAALLGLALDLLPESWPLAWWIGVLTLIGGAVLPVNAMLAKIIPFLVWLHLRRRLPMRVRVPAMQTLLPPPWQSVQVALLLMALASLLALPFAPLFWIPIAGGLFAVSQAMLGVLLLRVIARFVGLQREFGISAPWRETVQTELAVKSDV